MPRGIGKQIKMPEESGKENNHSKGLAGSNSVCPRVRKTDRTIYFKHGYLFHGLQKAGAILQYLPLPLYPPICLLNSRAFTEHFLPTEQAPSIE